MGRAWRNLNLDGGGLQAVNALLAARMRRRPRAYAAWILLFLRSGRNPPAGYRGRYASEADPEAVRRDLDAYKALKEAERAGHVAPTRGDAEGRSQAQGNRVPSFNEQEALLRELAGKRRARRGGTE